jgi:Mg-chelatase subunit ChlD
VSADWRRWRLVLGESAEGSGEGELRPDDVARDAALSWLYDREPGLRERDVRAGRSSAGHVAEGDDPRGGRGPSALSVPEWIASVHRLFPRSSVERLEKDAVDRYRIEELVTDPDVLRRVEPNVTLLEAILRTKHLMDEHVLELARVVVRRVVEALVQALEREVKQGFSGAVDRHRATTFRVSRNFDARRTVRANLQHWSAEEKKLYIRKPRFLARTGHHAAKWQLVLLVDQSGSMDRSLIHAAVTASCFWGIRALRTHLVLFDTSVVDVTEHVSDPVELLMRAQLGGGTDIGRAVAYAATLVQAPRRTIVVLITDFFEGGDPDTLVRAVHRLCEQGTIVLGLAALDVEANPSYDRDLARRLVEAGAHVAAMTPDQLAHWVAERVRA